MNSAQKNEEKSLEHNKKRSRPSLLRPVSAPAKVTVCVWVLTAHDSSGVEARTAGEPEPRAWPRGKAPAAGLAITRLLSCLGLL